MKLQKNTKELLIEIASTPLIFTISLIIMLYNVMRRIQELQL